MSSVPLNLSVVVNGDRILALPPVAAEVDIATIKNIIGLEINAPSSSIVLLHKQRVLIDTQTLTAIGVKSDDMLEARVGAVRPAAAAPPAANAAAAQNMLAQLAAAQQQQQQRSTNSLGIPDNILHDAGRVREFIRANQSLLFSIEAQNPQLYQAILMNDPAPFAAMWSRILENIEAEKRDQEDRMRLANADPMDPEVQARIAEEIRLKNVDENYRMAVEHAPESFGRVVMLYIPMKVNGRELQAFVDSGAQSTIMSVQCAERVGIMRLLDKRFAGIAKGVGSAKILGRVHQVPVQIGKYHTSMSFTILENQGMDFLFGLDQLKSHQACIDLGKNCLRIHGDEIQFLSEKDLPREKDGDEEIPQNYVPPASSSSSAANRPAAATPSTSPPAATTPPVASSTPSASNAAAVAAAERRLAGSAAATTPSPAPAAAAASPVRPSPTPAAAPAPSVPAARPAGGAYAPTPAQIQQLTDLGFSPQESVQALIQFGGNVDAAASFLFSS